MTILCDTCERRQGVVESARTRARGRETRGAAGSEGFSVARARVGVAPPGVAIDLQHFLASAPQIPLAFPFHNAYIIGIMSYTTQQVADLVGVDKQTLLRWLWRGEIPEPRSVRVGRIAHRLWGRVDLRRAREHKKRNYRRKNRARARGGRQGRRT